MSKKRAPSSRVLGYRTELDAVHRAEGFGYLVFRSAGSRGAFDILAMKPMDILAIQVKHTFSDTRNPLHYYKDDIQRIASELLGLPVKSMLWIKVKNKGWRDYFVTEQGLYKAVWRKGEPMLDEFVGEIITESAVGVET